MKILIASDEANHVTADVIEYLKDNDRDVILGGHLTSDNLKWQWAKIAKEAAKLQASGEITHTILFCWSGTGVSIAANKIKGIRAALCWDAETARLARKWDDANVLCLSSRYTSTQLAKEIIDTFLNTDFDEEDLDQVSKIE